MTARTDTPRPQDGLRRATGRPKRYLVATPILSALSEKAFQRQVVDGLKQRGYVVWVVPNMRMTTAGLPDVIAVHPDRARLLMFELKTETGRVRPAQKAALACLTKIPGVDARIVRPSDWRELSEEV